MGVHYDSGRIIGGIMSTEGALTLSYHDDHRDYVLECGIVTAVTDSVRADVMQVAIPTYSADNAFAFDKGAVENLQFTLVRRNPDDVQDPPYDLDDPRLNWADYDSSKWSNCVWKTALVYMINRWQMKTDGVSVLFIPLIQIDDPAYSSSDVYQSTIDTNGYLHTVNIVYDISSLEVLHVRINIAVGTMNRG